MEIILKEDIRSLGRAGEVVKVKEGYGRNYLLPQQKAVIATKASLKQLEADRKSIEVRREKLKGEAGQLATRIAALSLVLDREAGEEDKLFGSVTTRQIGEGLAALGIVLDHRLLHMKEPIRKIGTYTVDIHLHGEVVAPLKIEVRKK